MGSVETVVFYTTDTIFDVVVISYNGGKDEMVMTLHKN